MRFRDPKVGVLLLLLLASFVDDVPAADITMNDGKVYKNITVSRVEPDGIVIVTKTGIIKLYFIELPKDIQEKYGYDVAKAEVYAAAEAEKQRRLREWNAARSSPAAAAPPPTSPSNQAAPPVEKKIPPPSDANPPNNSGIVLDRYWETTVFAGGSATRKDLARLLSPFAKANRNLGPAPNLEIYQSVTYLMPLRVAAQKLGVTGKLSRKSDIICPGFPRSSMFQYAVDGTFDGEYNRMLIVTDRADQVLSIQLVAENPSATMSNSFRHWFRGDSDWHCYNFITHRVKTVPALRINHELSYQVDGRWVRQREDTPINAELVRADLALASKNDRWRSSTDERHKILETSRWFVPRPLAELLLHCLGRAGN